MGSPSHTQPSLYFRGFHAVRFIAVLLVLIGHFQTYSFQLSQKSGPIVRCFVDPSLFEHLGSVGVTLFFTLSGFLITSLLLREREATQKVAIGKFYLRRILRIWPLYFLYLAICFFVFPHLGPFSNPVSEGHLESHFWERFILYAALLPNVAFVFLPLMPYAFVLWSVGVEEQFYLFWPHLMKRVSTSRVLLWMLALLVALVALKAALIICNHVQEDALHDWVVLADRTRFGCMVMGGMAAVLLHRRSASLTWIFSTWVQVLALVALVALTVMGGTFALPILHQECVSFATALWLLNLAGNPKPIFSLEAGITRYLGRISYSMYIWHLPVIVGYLLLVGGDTFGSAILHFLPVLLLTVGVASVSYAVIERPFLRMKRGKSVVLSGEDAR